MLDIFISCMHRRNKFCNDPIPIDNYRCIRRYAFLSCWLARQHVASQLSGFLCDTILNAYALQSYHGLD